MSSKHDGQPADLFLILLSLLFIGLKLTGHITWSWWWVLSPIWIPITILIVVMFPIGLFSYLTWRKTNGR